MGGQSTNKAIVRRFVEAYNKQNLDLLDDLVSPDEPIGIILNL